MENLDYLNEYLLNEQEIEEDFKNINLNEKEDLFRALCNRRRPIEVTDEFLKKQDEYLREVKERKGVVEISDEYKMDEKIYLWQGDITRIHASAIVNAANSGGLGCFQPLHNCIDNQIHTYAGVQLRLECYENMNKIKTLQTGNAFITKAYNLASDFVIHTVDPIIQNDVLDKDKEDLKNAYLSSLKLATLYNIESIVFPCISTGVFHFPKDLASRIAIATVKEYISQNSNAPKVIFNVYSDTNYELYNNYLTKDGVYKRRIESIRRKYQENITENYEKRLETFKELIKNCDSILIGAGAGLSSAAGIWYDGENFEKEFKEYIDKYNFQDLYTATFYPFETEEEKWAFFAKKIKLHRYNEKPYKLYSDLLKILENKNYFVLSTNVDGQFYIAGFDEERVFEIQGSYGLLQCAKPCHEKLYSNEKLVDEWIANTRDCKIPSELVMKCPVCGGKMEMNLRKDETFVQDENWYKKHDAYLEFLKSNNNKKLLLIELGVGFNTPGIIRFPFEKMVKETENLRLVRINRHYPETYYDLSGKVLSFKEDMQDIIEYLLDNL